MTAQRDLGPERLYVRNPIPQKIGAANIASLDTDEISHVKPFEMTNFGGQGLNFGPRQKLAIPRFFRKQATPPSTQHARAYRVRTQY
jgi:hypothetical protein